ncbi:uroporphyrinogen-III C-methyltransferase [Limosilactobacillus walteri]|uniref:uroporphyrinogen-III C-methyltransferase n=1 Tax=Limosilactobacillus walteri TaxID=2268022 RepID=A0ABR8P504_9LACO|nr:uroporphyrinogen-III C-methyltransferase [Limosilactobacillus walteri]MBD5805816.1 uroporphyrinogen-III C-methyltransferase [Limosilactobacillus walteri]
MKGRVTLLGAGPGNSELLTLIGKRRLKEADVVLYDRLIDPSLLAFTAKNAELVDVGKMPLHHKVKQSKINEMLVNYANDGKKVVRLKAGDPYVFGRGGEEAQVLNNQGVNFEIIPGITSAIAGLAAAGIPITHRDYASSFHIITGHHKKDGQQLDWENIAHQEGTLVFLMGMAQLSNICQELISHGKDLQTPVAVIQWATQWRQKKVIGNLTNINDLVVKHQIGAPALIVVGNVVQLSDELSVRKPLDGIHLLVPFSARQRLFNLLTDLGATADFYSRQEKVPVATDFSAINKYSSILIDDVASFRQFIQLLIRNGKDLRVLAGKQIIAGNQSVAKHLKAMGLLVDKIMPVDISQTNLVELGGEKPQYNIGRFLKLYKEEHSLLTLPFELAEFSGVVFPSTASLNDFLTSLDEEQKSHLQSLKAFTMGKLICQAAQRCGFSEVINCQPNLQATVEKIKEEFARD